MGTWGEVAEMTTPSVPGRLGWILPVVCALVAEAPAAERLVTVTPEATDEILANPGVGWQTFHRTARQDRNLPDWIPSTVHYARWGWGELEPRPGELDAEFLDKVLAETRESGQQLAFRVMCASTYKGRPYHPKWIVELGGRELQCRYGDAGPFPVPDLDDPVVLDRHLDFIKRLGARYDGHADIDHVDLGTVGWWGEWHMSNSNCKMPSPETQKKIVDAYLASFKKTRLVMLMGGGEMLTHATRQGAGWRADCLGDLGGFSKTWCHMRKGYPFWIGQAGIEETWKTAPVMWETCWDMRKWVAEGWPLRYIFNYALALHGSQINNKSAPLPEGPDVRPEVERFLRRLGYRLVLRELTYPAAVAPGGTMELVMTWQNVGSAPCYRPYRLAWRLCDDAGRSTVRVGKTTVDRWLPGSIDVFTEEFFREPADLPPGEVHEVAEQLVLPRDLPAGQYVLSLAIVGDDEKPVVRLGIQGRAEDGWYPLGRMAVGP
jgi:hypothetical protein